MQPDHLDAVASVWSCPLFADAEVVFNLPSAPDVELLLTLDVGVASCPVQYLVVGVHPDYWFRSQDAF